MSSIMDEINKLGDNLQDSYEAISDKGGTLPANQNFDNLAEAISTIPSGTTITYDSSTQTLIFS